ncbi:M10 family metallopeptidase C-terminal domain-containing protein [Rhizobium sp. YIM 134829]|uniref:M10 family metallopeptidase C-terminal domain-containing protein n=1 Tax=Rhizobium sp. YIM 134829 TaxID=3390453 RepID=UPI00397C5BA9
MTIFYSFSLSSAAYSYSSSDVTDLPAHFRAYTAQQKLAAAFALDGGSNAAAVGFSVEGFTSANIQGLGDVDSTSGTHIRFAGTTSSSVGTARVADFPGNVISSDRSDNGDIWTGAAYDSRPIYDLRTPQAGNYAWLTQIHEIGHALGLKHPHETGWSFGGVPQNMDMMEFTVMTYRSYENVSVNRGLTNAQWSFAQTYMMLDIAALQTMYGADYTTNADATVYRWTPGSGDTLVNGAVAINAGGNTIFMTVWDGGGNDTYDFSAYSSALSIDLRPGKWSVLNLSQLADLGDGHTARGSVFNALQYHGNTASLIEDAIGGAGNDVIVGNEINNVLTGQGGSDTLRGGNGSDTASYATAASAVIASLADPGSNSGDAAGDTYDSIENLLGSQFGDTLSGDAFANALSGGGGDDLLSGAAGGDQLNGGNGSDTASYASALVGIFASLSNPSSNSGDAAGDTYDSIENLLGSQFNDTLSGDGLANTLSGGGGDDLLSGAAGGDQLNGGDGSDTASYASALAGIFASLSNPSSNSGDAAGDTYDAIENLLGSQFGDTLSGDAFANALSGGGGDDLLSGAAGGDQLNGGDGSDTASYASALAGIFASLSNPSSNSGDAAGDTYDAIENLLGSQFGDTLSGDAFANALSGGGGDDLLSGAAGGDQLNGGDGSDTASYASALAGIFASLSNPSSNSGDAAGDTYDAIENLLGSQFGDTLSGDAFANTLSGGGGDDLLSGAAGGDQLNGGDGSDTASYATAAAAVIASLANPGSNSSDAGGDTYGSIENLLGSRFNDRLSGNAFANTLSGVGGDDLSGGKGKDSLLGGAGKDKLDGGQGIDDLTGGSGADIFLFDDGETGSRNSSADTIFDFSQRQRDRIDISDIDANTKAKGDQAFDFIGSDKFDKHAGELRFVQSKSDTYISGDVNGDGKADFMIHLATALSLKAGYFLL